MHSNTQRYVPGNPVREERSDNSASENYFDLHTRGCGYMNRIRWVTPKGNGRKSEKFLACAINALHGKVNDPAYSYMDLRVSGEEAIALVSELLGDCEANRKIFVAFTVGDIYAHTYWRDVKEEGRKTGEQEPAAVIKGRLLLITHIAIDDTVVYRSDRDGNSGRDQSPLDENRNESGLQREMSEDQGNEAPTPELKEADDDSNQGHRFGTRHAGSGGVRLNGGKAAFAKENTAVARAPGSGFRPRVVAPN